MAFLIDFEAPLYIGSVGNGTELSGQVGWQRIVGASNFGVSTSAPVIEGSQSVVAVTGTPLTTYRKNLGISLIDNSDFSIEGGPLGGSSGLTWGIVLKFGAQVVWSIQLFKATVFPSVLPEEIDFIPTGGTPFNVTGVSVTGRKWGVKISGGNVEFLIDDISQHITTITELQYDSIELSSSSVNVTGTTVKFDVIQELATPPPPIPPSVPQGLSATPAVNKITLDWFPPMNPGTDPVSGYKIYRGTNAGQINLYRTVGDVLTFDDFNILGGQKYYYKVSAVSPVGEGPLTDRVTAVVFFPPSAPVSLTAVAASGQILLTWLPPFSPGGAITAYKVYRALVSGAIGTKTLVTTLGNVNDFTDLNLSNGTTYFYQVTAVSSSEGSASDEASGTPASNAIPAKPTGVFAIQRENYAVLSWNRVTQREDGHAIAVDSYQTGFEAPIFAIADLKDQDGWLLASQSSPAENITIQSLSVITGLQSAQFNFGGPSGDQHYLKGFPAIVIAYDVVWKAYMDTVVSDPHTIEIKVEAGANGGTIPKWSFALRNDDEAVFFAFGVPPITVPVTSGVTHEYRLKVRSAQVGFPTLTLFVDNVPVGQTTMISSLEIDTIEIEGASSAAYAGGSAIFDDFQIQLIGAADVQKYNIYRSFKINESDRTLIKTVVTLDAEDFVDSAFVDVNVKNVKIYRVSAVIQDGNDQLESQLSDRAVAIKVKSQIDRKTEIVDRKIMRWGTGVWGQLWA